MTHRRSAEKTGKNSDNKSSRSQRRLALAVLAVILCAGLFACLPDSGIAPELRQELRELLGITSDDGLGDGVTTGGNDGAGGGAGGFAREEAHDNDIADIDAIDPDALPEYDGHHFVTVNGSEPLFSDDMYESAGLVRKGGRWKTGGPFSRGVQTFESYGALDGLGRCTFAAGCLGEETMPLSGEDRGDISRIHPSGWAKAQNWERCHLIAWALSAENDNECNLITGTHYLNYDGMRPLEEQVEQYIWDTGNHVLYEAKPYFAGDELVARGVQLTAWSVEDEGRGVSFNVYCFNVTPGAMIDYTTGIVTTADQAAQEPRLYVINTRTGVFHYPTCEGAQQIYRTNRLEVTATRLELTAQGYTPCGYCEP